MLDITSSAVAAYYPQGEDRRFLAVAEGSYPSFRANTAFTFNSAWKRTRSRSQGLSYWRSERDNLSLALTARRAFVSDSDPFILGPGVTPPEDFDVFKEGAAFAGWADDAAAPLNRYLGSLSLPIQIPAGAALFALIPCGEENYTARIRLETATPTQARAVSAIMSLARIFIPALPRNQETLLVRALFSNPSELNGNKIDIRTNALTKEELALLFSSLTVYSR
jgi:hypothetical protein